LDSHDLPWLVRFADDADTWAHVDWLAIKVIGPCVSHDPKSSKLLRQWAKHDNFWVRRTAILALHDPLLAGKGNFELLEKLAVPMLHEREFFIRKAIGWLLRSAAKRRPELTIGFVERHAPKLSALSYREATRNLPASTQKRLQKLREAA
jgi:3-methyladenine DNA glycosylase AlkD